MRNLPFVEDGIIQQRYIIILIIIIIIIGLWLRLYSIDFGMPFLYDIDDRKPVWVYKLRSTEKP